MENFDSDKRYHVAAIVLIDIKKQTELFLITMSYLNISCCIENCPAVLKIPRKSFVLLTIFCKQNGLFFRHVFFTSVPQQPII